MKIIDFDHCGVHGRDRYPREWDHTMRREDCKEGDVMRTERDIFQTNRLFNSTAKDECERAIYGAKPKPTLYKRVNRLGAAWMQ